MGAASQRAGSAPAARAKRAPRGREAGKRAPIAIALAGGGPLGGIYEIGALVALSEALEGIDFNRLDVYVGVSAGGFVAAGLANGFTPGQLCRMFIESQAEVDDVVFRPQALYRPALREYAARAASVPPLLLAAAWDYLTHPIGGDLFQSFQRLGRAIPSGVFDSTEIDLFLRRLFALAGRSNDFRDLPHKLFLVATDLDSGDAVPFGDEGWDHVPISTAVRATSALPGLFPPVEIDGRFYVDGALKKTLHASVALKHGATLVICINPLVPFDSDLAAKRGTPKRESLVAGGLPAVLSQTFRSIIHSRMQVGIARYRTDYEDADVVLFEPNRDDADMFSTNVFRYSSRRRLSEHAYQKTRTELFRRRHELGPILARHGIGIRHDVLADRSRTLLRATRGTPRLRLKVSGASDVLERLRDCTDDLERWLSARRKAVRRAA